MRWMRTKSLIRIEVTKGTNMDRRKIELLITVQEVLHLPWNKAKKRRRANGSIVSSVIASEDMEIDKPTPERQREPEAEPSSAALRIRLKVNNESGRRPARAAAKRSGNRTKQVALEAALGEPCVFHKTIQPVHVSFTFNINCYSTPCYMFRTGRE